MRPAPRFWNDRELAEWATPIAALDIRPAHFSEREYYAAPAAEWYGPSVSVGTDPNLALKTRKGTGFYKVPSLKGVWCRGLFNHDGSVTTLEEWFDPTRLRQDFVPSGFVGYKVTRRAVPGHEFGLRLTAEDKAALIAFLKTL